MSKSTGSEAVVPATAGRVGTLQVITPVESSIVKKPGERSQAYEWTSKINHEDKQSGSYERYTIKEKASRGESHVEKGTGQVGVKDEFQTSRTVKCGNKDGYREYRVEERFRDVNFGKSNNEDHGPNKYIARHENDGCDSGSYSYCDSDDDDDDYY